MGLRLLCVCAGGFLRSLLPFRFLLYGFLLKPVGVSVFGGEAAAYVLAPSVLVGVLYLPAVRPDAGGHDMIVRAPRVVMTEDAVWVVAVS